MARQKVVVVREFGRPVDAVFGDLADHNKLQKVFGIPCKRVRDGYGDVNGVGSVRRLGLKPLAVEETVVAVDPNVSIDYEITKGGGPIQNHHGRLDFSSTARGSRVQWTIEFESPLPAVGPVVKFVLGQALGIDLKRLG